jgi:hypothetical protein
LGTVSSPITMPKPTEVIENSRLLPTPAAASASS